MVIKNDWFISMPRSRGWRQKWNKSRPYWSRFSENRKEEIIIFVEKKGGKISAQPHTIVKQISFPNSNVLFLSFFALSKNWMHNVRWGYAEILPTWEITIHFVMTHRNGIWKAKVQTQSKLQLFFIVYPGNNFLCTCFYSDRSHCFIVSFVNTRHLNPQSILKYQKGLRWRVSLSCGVICVVKRWMCRGPPTCKSTWLGLIRFDVWMNCRP